MAQGLGFLHDQALGHGDVRAGSALVTAAHQVKLCISISATPGLDRPALPWHSPEVLRGEVAVSTSADVYAFGISIAEVLSGSEPYGTLQDAALLQAVLGGLRPERVPEYSPSGTCYSDAWDVGERCWVAEAGGRPLMPEVISCLPEEAIQIPRELS